MKSKRTRTILVQNWVTNADGTINGTMAYYPYGGTRDGSVPTDKKFTGQRLDGTGLYYYNARYYDATIGRFISHKTFILNISFPQGFNRYTYLNNVLLAKLYTNDPHLWYAWYIFKDNLLLIEK